MVSRLSRSLVLAGCLVGPLLLYGCSVIHLYDAGKDSTAKDVKAKYSALNVPGLLAVETQNLDALLAEELAVVRDAHSLRLDLALLRLADDDEPIGAAVSGQITRRGQARMSAAARRLTGLGFADVTALRGFLNGADLVDSRAEAVRGRDDLIYAIAGRRAPSCDDPDFAKKEEQLTKNGPTGLKAEMLKDHLKAYGTACKEYGTAQDNIAKGQTLGNGEVRQGYDEWRDAEKALAKRRADARRFEQALKDASAEYERAVHQADGSEAGKKKIADAATILRNTLKEAAKASDAVGIPALSESRVQAIDTILTALSGGTVDANTVSDPGVQRAALVARELASLAGEIDVLVKRSRAPAVSPLVIEKQHQFLLRNDALRRVSLAEQRVALLGVRYDALAAEARFLLAQYDGVCNVLQPAKPEDGRVGCDSLKVTVSERSVACEYQVEVIGQATPVTRKDCGILAMTWSKGLREDSAAVKRALWESIAGLGGRLAIAQPQQDEAAFRLAHLSHLEVAASDEFAIRAWDGLIATPVTQLAAYHQTGIRPAELADLIVKAMGLGGIAIGVNR